MKRQKSRELNVVVEAIKARTSRKDSVTRDDIVALLKKLESKYKKENTSMGQLAFLFNFLELVYTFPNWSPNRFDIKFLYKGYKSLSDKFQSYMDKNIERLVAHRQQEIFLRLNKVINVPLFSSIKLHSIKTSNKVSAVTNQFKQLKIN